MKVAITLSIVFLIWLVFMILERCRFCGRIRPLWKMKEVDKWAHEGEYECVECRVMRELMGKDPGFQRTEKGH
jgi:hypothetical protein